MSAHTVRRAPSTSAAIAAGTLTPSAPVGTGVPSLPASNRQVRDVAVGAGAVQPFLGMGGRDTVSTGPEVAALKAQLRALHYLVDGGDVYTQATADAVMAFQKVNELGRDGVVGPRTRDALAHPLAPQLQGATAYRAEIDLTHQVLYMVKGGQLDYVVNASSGNPALWPKGAATVTPQGHFAVNIKRVGRDDGPNGPLFYPSYFHNGVAVHGSPSVPGYPASHGCVRIPRTAEQRVYRDLPMGREVFVHA